jgi:hypothetical protein
MAKGKPVYIFWDNSNIFLGAQTTYKVKGIPLSGGIRIDFSNLFQLAQANRAISAAYCVGSVPPQLEAVWKNLEQSTGVKPELYERGSATNTEQAIDQALQVYMLRALADAEQPAIAVLLTGDGAGYFEGAGFHADLQRMHQKGWSVELLSWDTCCKKGLKGWAERFGVYVPLDDFIDQITFQQGVNRVKALNLKRRKLAG